MKKFESVYLLQVRQYIYKFLIIIAAMTAAYLILLYGMMLKYSVYGLQIALNFARVYTKKIDVTLDDATLASLDDELIWGYSYDVDYKDGKLAILLRAPEQWYNEVDEQYFTYSSNVKAALVILDSEGLAYVATLDNSLCQASFGHHMQYDLIKPGTDGECYTETNPVISYSISWN